MGRDRNAVEVKRLLAESDPLPREPGLSDHEAQAIRRTVVAACDAAALNAGFWPRPLFVAATIAFTLTAGIILGSRVLPRDHAAGRSLATEAPPIMSSSTQVRQLQFATPGGTRIIWVFDPQFNP